MLNSDNPAFYEFSEQELARIDPRRYPSLFDRTIYESDEFRMYGFKIKRCPRTRSHDWTQCPYAHCGERARRRDPRRYNYAAVACPDYREDGDCIRGDACPFAHGVFEYWLHPDKYRTRPCNAGESCERKVCFFAHSLAELRHRRNGHRRLLAIDEPELGRSRRQRREASASSVAEQRPSEGTSTRGNNPDFLASLSGLTIRRGYHQRARGVQCQSEQQMINAPDIGWIADLLNE
ncbi:zinc finger CCCH domain-containing protein 54-like [Diospyros lotus]|uniref:zinc finger CCCH domain-containing protein 54-like n=1 Tax=Diospyros lotus TaxID=55363 RepID=UPI002254FFEE|nr:zinc finger CCCH domain-containing protein 54-like [Diospyros lotus]